MNLRTVLLHYIVAGTFLSIVGWTTTAYALIIDPFSEPVAGQIASQTGGGGATNFASGASILGGQRDITAAVFGGIGTIHTMAANAASSGVLTQTRVGTDTVYGLVQWDGPDSDGTTDYDGLSGIDFTAGGHNAVRMLVSTTSPVSIIVDVFTNDPDPEYSVLERTVTSAAPTWIYFPYADFEEGDGFADFTNVGAIMMILIGSGSGTTTVDIVETAMIPEPGSGALLSVGAIGWLLYVRRRMA